MKDCEKMWCGRPVRWSCLSTAETGGRGARTTKIQNLIFSQLLCHYRLEAKDFLLCRVPTGSMPRFLLIFIPFFFLSTFEDINRLSTPRSVYPLAPGLEYDRGLKFPVPKNAFVRDKRVQSVAISSARLKFGANINLIGGADPITEAVVDGRETEQCKAGIQTGQNEFSIAVNPEDPSNIVVGANDYRLYHPVSNRFDASGGFYRSIDGGETWLVGLLPGLVSNNLNAPGPYQAAGDPVVAAGPNNVFWYANIAFNRTDAANSIAVSRSIDGGTSWETSFVVQASALEGESVFHDKVWIAADPKDSSAAYVTWTRFGGTGSDPFPIVYSETRDGGRIWADPRPVSNQMFNQASVGIVDGSGKLHLAWVNYTNGGTSISYATKKKNNQRFSSVRKLADVSVLPDNPPWGEFRTPTFPALAADGKNLHIVWSDWNGKDADILYIRSTNNGKTWSAPIAIDNRASDQFFPWIAANQGHVFAVYLDHSKQKRNNYNATVVASNDHGLTWTAPEKISTRNSKTAQGNLFRYPDCIQFIGDYIGIAVGSDRMAHPVWIDIRFGNHSKGKADQDPYTAAIRFED
jgi:hypothetical protein